MKLPLIIITLLVLFVTLDSDTPSSYDRWSGTPAQANTLENDIRHYSGGLHDCNGYQGWIKTKPDYLPQDSFLASQCASKITGTPVEYIIAIHQIECNFGQSNAQDIRNKNKTCRDQGTKNGCSAAGAGQFIPQTWDKRNKNGKCNRKAQEIREGSFGELREPAREAGVPGYGMDCDGDGIANPWSIYDSACATGYYLSTINKDVNGDWFQTFQVYNGGWSPDKSRTVPYANGVMERATTFKSEAGL